MGNLTESTLEVVLVQKPPTWLQVIHERLKHLMINSETVLKGKKRGTNENDSLGTVNILISLQVNILIFKFTLESYSLKVTVMKS